MEIQITKHSKIRIKERMGLNKRSIQKLAEKSLIYGVSHSETKGILNKFITSLYFKNTSANNIKIYNRFVYIFVENILVTVLPLPKKFYKSASSIQEKKKIEIEVENKIKKDLELYDYK